MAQVASLIPWQLGGDEEPKSSGDDGWQCRPSRGEASPVSPMSQEEEEWLARQRLTGAIGRLVEYRLGDRPREDILGLRSGGNTRVMVTSVKDGGPAQRAGVTAGDELVSINGSKDFCNQPAEKIHESLRAPVTLIFVGFVGKLHAEVRLNRVEAVAGLSGRTSVVAGERGKQVQLCDEVVFKAGNAPLFLTTKVRRRGSGFDEGGAESMYELRREDARDMIHRVQRALGRDQVRTLPTDSEIRALPLARLERVNEVPPRPCGEKESEMSHRTIKSPFRASPQQPPRQSNRLMI